MYSINLRNKGIKTQMLVFLWSVDKYSCNEILEGTYVVHHSKRLAGRNQAEFRVYFEEMLNIKKIIRNRESWRNFGVMLKKISWKMENL